MRKLLKNVLICTVIAGLFWGISLLMDRQMLQDQVIRFHVVANSDSERDQNIKLRVRDAVLESLHHDLEDIGDVDAAKVYLEANLPKIERIANETLAVLGFDGEAVVTLCKEAFDARTYDTFTLPAGVYESLRIVIGSGAGHNWWCVAFPALCIPATSQGFSVQAVSAGFTQSLSNTLTGEPGYKIRFYLLDMLGNLENILFEG